MQLVSSIVLFLFILAGSAAAQVQGLGYRLAPTGSYVMFNDDAGLDDVLMYGGTVGLSFGEFIELSALYQTSSGTTTSFDGFLSDQPGLATALSTLTAQNIGVERYGGQLKLNLLSGALVPFVTGGGGVLRLTPDGLESSKNLYLVGGAGLQFTVADRIGLALSAENMAYRYSPGSAFFPSDDLATIGLVPGDFPSTDVLNWMGRASLQVYLGGRRPGEFSNLDRELQRNLRGGLSGLSLRLEPFYGRSNFDDVLGYQDQTFIGGEAGIDLGSLVGLRGFYGRGTVSDDPTDFQDIQMYGGNARFRLNEGNGAIPFITLGGGYLDIMDGYDRFAANPLNPAEDRYFGLAGAGLELPLSRRIQLVGEARALVMSTQDAEDVSNPDDIYLSPMYRAGLSLALGGGSGSSPAIVRRSELDKERAALKAEIEDQRQRASALESDAAERELTIESNIASARAQGDSSAVARLQAERQRAQMETDRAAENRTRLDEQARRMADSEAVRVNEDVRVVTSDGSVRSNVGSRMITLPVPENGELYVRYGEPGAVTINDATLSERNSGDAPDRQATAAEAPRAAPTEADLRTMVREAMALALADARANSSGAVSEEEIARRVEDRLADRLRGQLGQTNGVTSSDINQMERRLSDRFDEQLRLLRLQQMVERGQSNQPIYVSPGNSPSGGVQQTPVVRFDSTAQRVGYVDRVSPAPYTGFYAFTPVIGLTFGSDLNSAVVGARGRYATGGSVSYLPEILVGVTGRRSFTGNFDALFGLPTEVFAPVAQPYLRAGLGFVYAAGEDATDDIVAVDRIADIALNLGLGADVAYGGGQFLVDFSTANFGQYNRFTAGYRLTFGGAR